MTSKQICVFCSGLLPFFRAHREAHKPLFARSFSCVPCLRQARPIIAVTLSICTRVKPQGSSLREPVTLLGCLQDEWCARNVNPHDLPELKRAKDRNTSICEQVQTRASLLPASLYVCLLLIVLQPTSDSSLCPMQRFRYIGKFKYTFRLAPPA